MQPISRHKPDGDRAASGQSAPAASEILKCGNSLSGGRIHRVVDIPTITLTDRPTKRSTVDRRVHRCSMADPTHQDRQLHRNAGSKCNRNLLSAELAEDLRRSRNRSPAPDSPLLFCHCRRMRLRRVTSANNHQTRLTVILLTLALAFQSMLTGWVFAATAAPDTFGVICTSSPEGARLPAKPDRTHDCPCGINCRANAHLQMTTSPSAGQSIPSRYADLVVLDHADKALSQRSSRWPSISSDDQARHDRSLGNLWIPSCQAEISAVLVYAC